MLEDIKKAAAPVSRTDSYGPTGNSGGPESGDLHETIGKANSIADRAESAIYRRTVRKTGHGA